MLTHYVLTPQCGRNLGPAMPPWVQWIVSCPPTVTHPILPATCTLTTVIVAVPWIPPGLEVPRRVTTTYLPYLWIALKPVLLICHWLLNQDTLRVHHSTIMPHKGDLVAVVAAVAVVQEGHL